ncbi:alpha/beta hydrolase [Streptomyces sp. NPDC051219]|uniref:alpha/beta hydrolase n=1 Tax=Streptomyces sp. NPDC051219 TaxID=3155283 RepID=UPI003427DDCC
MADSQLPWGVVALSEPAWRTKHSWYLVAADNRMIPRRLRRAMAEWASATVVEVPGSNFVCVSQPGTVVDLIKRVTAC